MSKLIESLKAGAKEFAKNSSQDKSPQKSNYEMTQEQLANIYFSSSKKNKLSELPLVIRVADQPVRASFLPWLLTSLAFLLAAFSLFSTKRIFVDVKVIDEKNPYFSNMAPGSSVSGAMQRNIDTQPQGKDEVLLATMIPMQNVVFEGASKLKSFKNGAELTLVNSSIAPFARANLYFNLPLNLQGSKIVFFAKGQKGGENIALAMKDKDNMQAFHKGEFYPFPAGLSTSWQKVEIPLSETAEDFDAKRVTNIRFEFGSKDTQNKPGDTIWVKELQVLPI